MKTASEIQAAVEKFGDDHLSLLRECGGYYECPKDEQGCRLGPLVAYRGQYELGRRYVGDIYANFAMAEQFPFVVRHFASCLLGLLSGVEIDVFCGAPEGGKSLADKLAMFTKLRYVYPEKKEGALVWGRHSVRTGERVVIVEDVSNNFSTTEKMVELIIGDGATPVLIVSFLNRSLTVDDMWSKEGFPDIPVVSLVRKRIQEYRQDDPQVEEDIRNSNIVWNVKSDWGWLEKAMHDA